LIAHWTRKHKFVTAIISLFLILGVSLIYFLNLASNLFGDDPFLTALLRSDDSLNTQYLSTEFQQYISQNCPNGKASACIRLISSNWGELTSVKFGIGSPNTELFYSWWSNSKPIVIVLLVGEENGHQVYTGWRGFVPAEGENRDAELLSGKRRDNEFPPPT
jgi:hypothetical protein